VFQINVSLNALKVSFLACLAPGSVTARATVATAVMKSVVRKYVVVRVFHRDVSDEDGCP